jgi:hypothetical protein
MLIMAAACIPSGNLWAGDGQWSRFAQSVPSGRIFSVPSPDRTRTIVISNRELTVLEGGQPVEGAEGISILLPAEIGWAQDGKAFFITSSDGGQQGTWDVSIFLLERDRFSFEVVTEQAVDLFLKAYPCAASPVPHVGLLRFTKDSKQALLAVEAASGSSCAERDAVRGFIVDVPSGDVLRELELQRLVKEWGETLGSRFERVLRSRER